MAKKYDAELHTLSIPNSLDLLNDLRHGDEAIGILVSCGNSAIYPLRLFLKEGKPSHIYRPRQRAVEVLAKLGAKDDLLEYLCMEKEIKDPVIRFGEEAVENSAARALSEWLTEDVYSTLMAISQSRLLPGAIETLGRFRRSETVPLFIAALGDDMCNGPAQTALQLLGEIAKPGLLDILSANGCELDESPSTLIRKRSAVRILSGLNLSSDDWQRVSHLMDSDDLEISITISRMAMKHSDDRGKKHAVKKLIESIGIADWHIQDEIQGCLLENYGTTHGFIGSEISKRSKNESCRKDRIFQFLLYLRKRMINSV